MSTREVIAMKYGTYYTPSNEGPFMPGFFEIPEEEEGLVCTSAHDSPQKTQQSQTHRTGTSGNDQQQDSSTVPD